MECGRGSAFSMDVDGEYEVLGMERSANDVAECWARMAGLAGFLSRSTGFRKKAGISDETFRSDMLDSLSIEGDEVREGTGRSTTFAFPTLKMQMATAMSQMPNLKADALSAS